MMPNHDGWIQQLWAWADTNDISYYTIPRNEYELAQLTSLDLGNSIFNLLVEKPKVKLTVLPRELFNLTQLTKLYLGGNQLTSLPPEIGRLTQLKQLDLDGNQFTPQKIEELRQLLPADCNISVDNQKPVSALALEPEDFFVTCTNCHSNIKNPSNNLCPSCGKNLYNKDTNVHCNACGSDYPAGEPYCPICGAGMPKQATNHDTPLSPSVQASDDEEARLIAELEALKKQARIAELKKQIAESKAKLGL